MKFAFGIAIFSLLSFTLRAEDGYRLWLRYDRISNTTLLQEYNKQIAGFRFFDQSSPTLFAAKKELITGLSGLLAKKIDTDANSIVIAKFSNPRMSTLIGNDPAELGQEGFVIRTIGKQIVIAANTDVGILYGVFQFLRLIQTNCNIQRLNIAGVPKIKYRVLNHWDNLNRYVERGYAGISIFNWQTLPGYLDQRYTDYARANASIGINGTELTNVNANTLVLTKDYLVKASALADVFRPYGIRVFFNLEIQCTYRNWRVEDCRPAGNSIAAAATTNRYKRANKFKDQ